MRAPPQGFADLIGFNPCSLGCCSESFIEFPNTICFGGVSILVLLDVALKVKTKRNSPIFGSVSILVLLDVALKDRVADPGRDAGVHVSILVLLDVALKAQ